MSAVVIDGVNTENTEHDGNAFIEHFEIETGDDNVANNAIQRRILSVQTAVANSYETHSILVWKLICILGLLLYFAYCVWAFWYKFGDEGSWRLLGISVLGVVLAFGVKLKRRYGNQINQWWDSTSEFRNPRCMNRIRLSTQWFLRIGVLIALILYIIIDIAIDQPENLISLAGLVIYILIFWVTSINPARVNWHTVYWGIALQYIFALLVLRTKWGYDILKWLGDRATDFMEYTVAGILFVFGDSYTQHFFAMKVLPIVVFLSTVISILYYIGVMQAVIGVIGRFLAFCLETTATESINTAANIFCSMNESPLMIRPFLNGMTRSELHAVMTGGFATIAGSVLAAYIAFGVPANHLLSASVMSAPAALAISKLSYPETEIVATGSIQMERPPERNIIEAASNGATGSIKLIGAIATNVLAFLSLLAFVNASLTWFGDRVGIDNLTFELISSYVLYPVAYFMGVETSDCGKVAELIGVKTFTNEFIAYGHLKILIANRKSLTNYTEFYNNTGGWYWQNGDVVLNLTQEVLKSGVISVKSQIISIYALCGFANIGSIGITLGVLGSLAADRRRDLTEMVLRAMICGNVACFLTACIAGLLYKPFP